MKNFFGTPKSRIIFAADLPTYQENAGVLDKIKDHIDVIKVNCPLLYSEDGAEVIKRLYDKYGKPIFADLKIGDVPHTNANIIKVVKENHAAAAMVHGFVGPDSIMACIDAAGDELGIIIQLELTNPGGKIFTAPIANDMAKLASKLNVYGFQSPGNRPDRIREIRGIVGVEPVIVCCGVGVQGGDFKTVIESGGTYAIIGRSIYTSPDPKKIVINLTENACEFGGCK